MTAEAAPGPGGQSLLIDADDTLWENNVLFESGFASFAEHLAQTGATPELLRQRLEAIERINVHRYGYGVNSFERSLTDLIAEVRGVETVITPDRDAVRQACAPIREHHIELLPDVTATLEQLATRHRLYLVTKGDSVEQQAKIEASGLTTFFTGIEIVAEKDAAAYHRVLRTHGLGPAGSWMIGNSPRSDIAPALEAGLGAVLVPHPMTWSLEVATVAEDHPRFRSVAAFAELTAMF